jgi:hypothetical protein
MQAIQAAQAPKARVMPAIQAAQASLSTQAAKAAQVMPTKQTMQAPQAISAAAQTAQAQQESKPRLEQVKESLEQIIKASDFVLFDTSAIVLERSKNLLHYIYARAGRPVRIEKEPISNAIDYAVFLNQIVKAYKQKIAITPAIASEIKMGIRAMRNFVYNAKKCKKARETFYMLNRLANLDEELLNNMPKLKPPKQVEAYISYFASQLNLNLSKADKQLLALSLYLYSQNQNSQSTQNLQNPSLQNQIALISNDKDFIPLLKAISQNLSQDSLESRDSQSHSSCQYQQASLRLYNNLNKQAIYKEVLRI